MLLQGDIAGFSWPVSVHGLYVITDSQLLTSDNLIAAVEQAIQGGARLVQYRDKGTDQTRRLQEAGALLERCRQQQIPLLINDDVALAQQIGADGVHLGQDDTSLAEARRRLGPEAIVGVSCYNQLQRAQQAEQDGASYVAFGRFFSSQTKPQALQANIDLLHQARQLLHVPVVAIGGITPENGGPLLAAGADMLAVIHGVFGQPDITAAARNYSDLFTK